MCWGSDEQKVANPVLGLMTSDDVKAYIAHLVQIKYAFIETKTV